MKKSANKSKNIQDMRGKENAYSHTRDRFDKVQNFESAASAARKQMKDEPRDIATDKVNVLRQGTMGYKDTGVRRALDLKNKKLDAEPTKFNKSKDAKFFLK